MDGHPLHVPSAVGPCNAHSRLSRQWQSVILDIPCTLKSWMNVELIVAERGDCPRELDLLGILPVIVIQFRQKCGVEPTRDEVTVGEDSLMQRNCGLYALDNEHVEGAPHPRDCLPAIVAVRDQLRD